jgi:hypothetical protein
VVNTESAKESKILIPDWDLLQDHLVSEKFLVVEWQVELETPLIDTSLIEQQDSFDLL